MNRTIMINRNRKRVVNKKNNPNISCILCDSKQCILLGNKIFLKKYRRNIYKCKCCKLCFVNKPYWLQEAYSIIYKNNPDSGRFLRADIVSEFVKKNFDTNLSILDFGSGSEMILKQKLQNDYSNYTCYDKHHTSICDESILNKHYDLFISIEVLEHIENCKDFFDKYHSIGNTFLFSTCLYGNNHVPNWYYLLQDFGQHISFYHSQTFDYIAKKYNFNVNIIQNNRAFGLTFIILSKKE